MPDLKGPFISFHLVIHIYVWQLDDSKKHSKTSLKLEMTLNRNLDDLPPSSVRQNPKVQESSDLEPIFVAQNNLQ